MGRSVSTHQYAVATVFINHDSNDSTFPDFIDDVRDVLTRKYPSLTYCSRWSGRENRILAENSHVEISVSEYCGLAAVCLAPVDPCNGFHHAVAERMAKSFDKHLTKAFKGSALKSIGHANNGEQFFTKV